MYSIEKAEEGSYEVDALLAKGFKPFAVVVVPTVEEIERYDRVFDGMRGTGEYQTTGHVTWVWFRREGGR